MDTVIDRKVPGMNRTKSLGDILNLPPGMASPASAPPEPEPEPEGELPPLDGLSPLPRPGDPYKAHARAANGPLPTLHVLLKNASSRGFSYANYDSIDWLPDDDAGQGPAIVVRFAGLVPCELRISGRNLEVLHNYIGHCRIGWIRELPTQGDFIDKAAPLIRSVKFVTLER